MSQALYRKYRSKSLDEVLGQDHVTNILKSALKKDAISHAYLLTGPHGTGKTSIARILAYEVNKLPYDSDKAHLDIIEIDAASNNGVDHIRDLREKARITPSSTKYKVYIIDEVHMLSKAAFNALLKTLEEPPEHIIFILATTNPDKLPATILSRVQQYYLRPISQTVIAEHLISIANNEGFKIDSEAAYLIAKHAKGGFRDSISILDQLSSLADKKQPLTKQHVLDSLGLNDDDTIRQLIEAHRTKDSKQIISIIDQLESTGSDPIIITKQILSQMRTELIDHPEYVNSIDKLIDTTKHAHPDLKLLTALLPREDASTALNQQPPPKLVQEIDRVDGKNIAATHKVEPKPLVVESPDVKYNKQTTPKPDKSTTPDNKKDQQPTPKPFKGEFNWSSMLVEAKKHSMGLFGLLSQCGHDYEDSRIKIYAGTPFAQKKLDDAKNRPLISQIIFDSHGGDIEVLILKEKKPPADDKLASIAEMMGGGVEFNLEKTS